MPLILVADDNPLTLRFFADALERLGATTVLANDGLEAWRRAETNRCDLLLLDDNMPGLNGAMAMARIRAGTGLSHGAPAMATTSGNDTRTRNRLLAAGFIEVLQKPVTLAELRSVLLRNDIVLEPAQVRSDAPPSVAEPPPPVAATIEPLFDDARAMTAVGGDPAIVAALRGLLGAELDALPDELARMACEGDRGGLVERLHRLDASAGFCGATSLTAAVADLRSHLGTAPGWPTSAQAYFLERCDQVRSALGGLTPAPAQTATN